MTVFPLRCSPKYPLLYLLLCGALFFTNCSNLTLAGGTSTTDNPKVIGAIIDTDGFPATNTRVNLLPVNFDPVRDSGTIVADTTDALGRYVLPASRQGVFNIQAVHLFNRTRLLIQGVVIAADNDSFEVDVDTLEPSGAVVAELPGSIDRANGYLYIPGTTVSAFLDSVGTQVTLDSVPAATIPAVCYTTKNAIVPTVLRYDVCVLPGATVILTMPNWKYSARLTLNTTSSGADVAGDVMNFPVLVRLNSGIFTFSQTLTNGDDIRFTKDNGSPLPFEIERWDQVAGHAEVWVKVDTVHGGDSTQSLMMFWGNSAAASESNGAAVFDTGSGFQGVWHLNEAGNATARDATDNHYDGTPSDTAPASTEGSVGPCRVFNGSSNFIRMNGTAGGKLNFSENDTYAISAWVYADTIDDGFHMIAGKSNEQYALKFKRSTSGNPMVWELVEYHDRTGWYITNSLPVLPTARTWAYLVGVRMGTDQHFYLNGELVDTTISISPGSAPRYTGDDVTIGKFLSIPADTIEGKCPFHGKIDEVRISNVAHGPDWIKLCYMNQKEPDALVKW